MQLSAFKSYVLQDFKRTDKDTELVQAYNDSIMHVSLLMPQGDYKYQSYIPTVIGQPSFALPGDIIYLAHPVRILDGAGSSDGGYALDHITKAEYDELEPNPNRANPSTGKPQKYCIFSRAILPTPIPDKTSYYLEITWSKRPVAQAADADVHLLGSEWDQVLKWMTLSRLNAGMELFGEAQYWEAKYQDSMGTPIGLLRTLLDIEREREHKAIGQVRFNNL